MKIDPEKLIGKKIISVDAIACNVLHLQLDDGTWISITTELALTNPASLYAIVIEEGWKE
jgi:hypothetical protein